MQARERIVFSLFYGTFLFASGALFMPIEMQCLYYAFYVTTYYLAHIIIYFLHTYFIIISFTFTVLKVCRYKKAHGIMCHHNNATGCAYS